jgi:hypothetical protein
MELRLAKRVCLAHEINELELITSSQATWNAFEHASDLLSTWRIPYVVSTPYEVQEMAERVIK